VQINLFAVSDGIRRKTKIYEQFQVETEKKKYFFDRFPQIENRKTEKFIPPAEKQLSYLELG